MSESLEPQSSVSGQSSAKQAKPQYTSPFDAPGIMPACSEDWQAKRRVADAARDLISALVTCTSSAEDLTAAAQQIEAQAAVLRQSEQLYGRSQFEQRQGGVYKQTMGSLGYELNPMDGQSNPIASHFDMWFENDRVHGKVFMDWQYEGPPNSVHGGFVAALFDQFLGVGQTLTGQPGFTGTLAVRYIKPTPIATQLRLEGWVEKVEGRKNILKAEMWAGDVKTATCEGLFISVTKAMVDALKSSRQ